MNKRTLILVFLFFVVVFWLLVTNPWETHQVKPTVESTKDVDDSAKLPVNINENDRSKEAQVDPLPTEKELRDVLESPIEFYGRVIDQDDKPVAKVDIRCSWPLMASTDGTIIISTDPEGVFFVKDEIGMEMRFSVINPKGYRSTETSTQNFRFAGDSPKDQNAYKKIGGRIASKHIPNQANPVVFRIQKVGNSEVLLKAHQGADLLPVDGSPRYYSLSEPSQESLVNPRPHSIEIRLLSEKTLDDDGLLPRSWSMEISVPGGGLQVIDVDKNPISDDYDSLEAPEGGYQAKMIFRFPKGIQEWKTQFTKDFVFYFADKTYGRATVTGSWEHVRIQSLFNPTGSRNLLFDETKVIEPIKAP